MTGADYIIDFLKRKGVEILFGYPGASVLELYDALADSPIRHILMRHEQGVAHAACGYAKASGRPGVCLATSGPGAANLVTGIADANLDSVPLLILTGQVDTNRIGRDAFQEADILGITMPITKHSYLVRTKETLPTALEEAWQIAVSRRPGPVLIDVAHDVLKGEMDLSLPVTPVLPRQRVNESPLDKQIDAIQSALAEAKKPLLLAGGGVVIGRASDALSRFAAASGIPLVTTLPGMGISLTESLRDQILILGMAGLYGSPASSYAMENADLVIAVGTRMSDRTLRDFASFSRGKTILHCDIDQAELQKNVPASIAVCEDAKVFLSTLLPLLPDGFKTKIEDWRSELATRKIKTELPLCSSSLTVQEILRTIDNAERKRCDAVYVTDVGNHQMCAAKEMEPHFERGFLTSAGLGVMGFGLPGAVGASFSAPDGCRQILLLCGDGGFQMTMQELPLLKQTPLPIKIFLFDNHSLGMIRQMQDARFNGRRTDSDLPGSPDFQMIGKAYGLATETLDLSCRSTLHSKIEAILDRNEPILVHCLTE